MDAEAKAKDSGDPAAVIDTSKRVAALTLLELARARSEAGSKAEAAELLKKSLSLEFRADTRAALDKASRASTNANQGTQRSARGGRTGSGNSQAAQPRSEKHFRAEAQYRELLGSSFNDMGTAEARQGKDEQALHDFQEAQRWAPSLPGLQRNLGMAAFRASNFTESARAFEAITQTDPADAQSRLLLGMSLFSMDRFREASQAFAPIPEVALKDPRSAYSMIYSLARSDQQARANELLDQLTAGSLPPDALNLFCQIYNTTENYEHSAACFRRVYQAAPTTPRAHYQVGLALIRLDRPAEAIPELREEVRLALNDPDVQYQLAYALLEASQKDEAMQLLRTVVSERPEHAEAQYELGKLLLEGGNVPEAIQHLEIAARIDPAKDYIHYQLQSAYRKQGRSADAERELASYRAIKAKRRESPSASAH